MVSLEFLKEKEKSQTSQCTGSRAAPASVREQQEAAFAGELGKWAAQGQRGRVGESGTGIGTS